MQSLEYLSTLAFGFLMGRNRQFDEYDVLERATRWVWRHGFSATSMRDIVAATGVAKASIYNAFGSREAFFQRLLIYYIERKQAQSLTLLKAARTGRAALQAYLDGVLHSPSDESYMSGCLIINIAAEQPALDDEAQATINYGLTLIEEQLTRTIERGVKDGSIDRATEPTVAVPCLLATILGLYVLKRQGICQNKLQDMIDAVLDAFAPTNRLVRSEVA
ncbi:TetR/AcrR family transcriptional regulator [uncultured Cohaesibacter sp.]|uniref:TetR/AcrR family transcriptional regulator n=1 Tax=uncultured Cohaesibacter sp. TaxID=1002546 RepID=UPI0029C85493|nr:TetR/AcrR family transcriptional regulator [uncultured Cohaesibacter sp.]